MDFTPELALALYNSEDEFPVDFDLAWQWIKYEKRGHAESKLLNNFAINVDYKIDGRSSPSTGGREANRYSLTVDCFKSLGMMAATSKGREIRQHFLDCERKLKQLVAEKAIRDLNINTQVNVSTDPHANVFRPEYVEKIRQVRLEAEKIRDEFALHQPAQAEMLICVLFQQFALEYGVVLDGNEVFRREFLTVTAAGIVESPASKAEKKPSQEIALNKYEVLERVVAAVDGRTEVIAQEIAQEVLMKDFPAASANSAYWRVRNALVTLGYKRSYSKYANGIDCFETRTVFVKEV